MPEFVRKLWDRNVFKFGALYLGAAWVMLQVAVIIEQTLKLPDWVDQAALVFLVICFPIALILAWAQESQASKAAASIPMPDFDRAVANIAAETKTVASPKSIAVLPFADMSPEGDQEYFGDGIAEEILNALVRAPELKVAGRTSSFVFKGKNIDIREIGETLSVAHVLEGSVRKQGQQVRITAQLIRANDGFHMWSETFDGTLENVFELQEAISRKIAEELEALLSVGKDVRLATKLSNNAEAYDLFLRGRALSNQVWGENTMTEAVAFLEQALELDPEFTQAGLELAYCYYMLPQYKYVPDESVYMEKSKKICKRLLKNHPDNLRAQIQQATIAVYDRDYKTIAKVVRDVYSQAREQDRIDEELEFMCGYYFLVLGHTRQALPLLKSATDKSPTMGMWLLQYANALFNDGQWEEAERMALRSDSLGFYGAGTRAAEIMAARGNRKGAIAYWNAAYPRMESFFKSTMQGEREWKLASKALFGKAPIARTFMRHVMTKMLRDPAVSKGTQIVNGFRMLGQAEQFMKAFENHKFSNSSFVLTLLWDDTPGSKKIREHPDFLNWAKRITLVDAWNEIGWPDKVLAPDQPNSST